MEELRIQKDKNEKLSQQFKREEETRQKQSEKMKEIEDKNKQYYNELLSLKEQGKKLGLDTSSRDNSLPPIENEEEKQKLRNDLETEYFH